jgi:hypothetical protein
MIGALIESCALAEPTNPTPVSSAAMREYLTSLFIPMLLQIDLAKTRGFKPALNEPHNLSFLHQVTETWAQKTTKRSSQRGTLTVYEPKVNDNCCVPYRIDPM